MAPRGGSRRVLLVEGDQLLARVIARELGRRHRVSVVRSVTAALRALTGDDRGSFDVVVFNYHLGRRASGGFLSGVLQRRWPTVRRVLYADAGLPDRGRDAADAVIEMPGDFEQLLRAVDGPSL